MGVFILIKMIKKGVTEEVPLEKRSEGELGATQAQTFRGKMFNNTSLLDVISTQTSYKSKLKFNTKTCFSPGFAISGNQHTSQKLKSPSLAL